MQFTESFIHNIQPTEVPFKLADGNSLYLLVNPNGSMYWRMNCRINKRQQTIALGVYPEIGREKARQRRDSAKKQVKQGIKPSFKKYDKPFPVNSSKLAAIPDDELAKELKQRGFQVKSVNYRQTTLSPFATKPTQAP